MQAADLAHLVTSETTSTNRFFRAFRQKFTPRFLRDNAAHSEEDEASEEANAQEAREEADNESTNETRPNNAVTAFMGKINVHVFFLILILAVTFNWSAAGSSVARKVCLNYNRTTDTFCNSFKEGPSSRVSLSFDDLFSRHHKHKHAKSEAQETSELYSFYQGLVGFVPPAFFVLMLASCYDEFSSYNFNLVVSIVGSLLTTIGNLVSSLFPRAPLFYDVLTPLGEMLFGGLPLALTCVYTHVAASFDRSRRTRVFFILQIVFMFAFSLGRLISTLVVQQSHRVLPMFVAAIVLFGLSMIYATFGLRSVDLKADDNDRIAASNSGRRRHRRVSGGQSHSSNPMHLASRLFSHHHLFASLKGLVQQRARGTRYELLFLIVVVFCLVVTTRSSVSSFFLDADPANAVLDSVVIIVTLVLVLPLLVLIIKIIPIDANYTITFFGLLFLAIGQSLQFASNSPALNHVRQVLHTISNIAPAGIRAHIATLVERRNFGKAYAVVAACECIAPLIGSVFRKYIGHTLGQFPFIFLIGGLVLFLGLRHLKGGQLEPPGASVNS